MGSEFIGRDNAGRNLLPDFEVCDDTPPQIPEGTYTVVFNNYKTALMFGKAKKLIIEFTIIDFGPYHGLRLERYYNVTALKGKPQKSGKFRASKKGDFLREFISLFPDKFSRLDRIPMSAFLGTEIEAEVVTVKEARGNKIPIPLRYSKIGRLKRVIGG